MIFLFLFYFILKKKNYIKTLFNVHEFLFLLFNKFPFLFFIFLNMKTFIYKFHYINKYINVLLTYLLEEKF